MMNLAEKFQWLRPQVATIAKAQKPWVIQRELRRQTHLGQTSDGQDIYLCQGLKRSRLLKEIGRLREISFRAVGEGTGQKRDVDRFDRHYQHIVLFNATAGEIVGAYRLGRAHYARKDRLYSSTLFNYHPDMARYFAQGLELGRSFVQPKYWGKRALDYLWQGIGLYLQQHPDIRYLFGPVSVSAEMPQPAQDLLVAFYSKHFSAEQRLATHRLRVRPDPALMALFTGDYASDLKVFKTELAKLGASIPTLYKQYTELCEPGGAQFLDFGVDPDFADCVDGLVLVDLDQLKAKKRERYLGKPSTDREFRA